LPPALPLAPVSVSVAASIGTTVHATAPTAQLIAHNRRGDKILGARIEFFLLPTCFKRSNRTANKTSLPDGQEPARPKNQSAVTNKLRRNFRQEIGVCQANSNNSANGG
jgi:hypothetical protein